MDTLTEQRLRQILSSCPAIIYTCRAEDLTPTFVSDNITEHFGYTVEDCLDTPGFWSDNLHPADRERILAAHDLVFTQGRNSQEYRFRKKDGDYVWIQDEVRLVCDAAGKPAEIIGSWLDITQRKHEEGARFKSEQLFRAFFALNPIPSIVTSFDGTVLMVNPAFERDSGRRAEDVVGRRSQDLGFWCRQEDRERMIAVIAEKGSVDRMEACFRGADNAEKICVLSSRATEIDGEIMVLSVLFDVTELREKEDGLKKSEALFRDFFMANPVPTIISTSEGVVTMVNKAFELNPGYAADEVAGRTVQELGFWRIPADRERMVEAIRTQGFIDNLESSFYGKGLRPMTCLISSRAIEFGGEMRILSTVFDVTEQRRAEEAMRELERVKSDFISTVAHELRTPLIAIVGYCELLENIEELPVSEQQKKDYLDIILSNAEILNRLVDDLLDVGRMQMGRALGVLCKENNLLSVVDKVTASFALKSGRHEIVVTKDKSVPESLFFDAGRIAQVLHNLLSNAIKYTPAGGVIKVELARWHDKVAVSVVDRGIGMSAEQVAHIFDRFYRVDATGASSSGLGLGLSIAKQIIADHGGEMTVESGLGAGTTITFTLPVKR